MDDVGAEDMTATAIVQFEVEARTGDEAVSKARSMFDDAIEQSDLMGSGGLGPLRTLRMVPDGASTYLASATALFQVLVPQGADAMQVASDRLAAEIEESPFLDCGAVCSVHD